MVSLNRPSRPELFQSNYHDLIETIAKIFIIQHKSVGSSFSKSSQNPGSPPKRKGAAASPPTKKSLQHNNYQLITSNIALCQTVQRKGDR